jgi:hypothetical protein
LATEIERDAQLVIRTLYTWSQSEHDQRIDRYSIDAQELLDATGLTYERVEDAATLLKQRGHVKAAITTGGLQEIFPTAAGRAEFQRATINAAPAEAAADFDVSLSHSCFDDHLAEDVKLLLDHSGIRTFVTPSSIPSGKWEPRIEEALQKSTHVWVLLTRSALHQSVWVHQELGYFYGFRHGQGVDPLGHRCHYAYEDGSLRPGLYAELQGVAVADLGDPVAVATVIASDQGRTLLVPADWEPHTYRISTYGDRSQEQQFEREVEDILRSQVSSTLATQGYWQVVIRPTVFQESRVSDFSTLYALVRDSQTKLARCDFPSMDGEAYSQSGANWIGEEFTGDIPEVWRIHQSGQFVALSAFWDNLEQLSHRSGLGREV